MQQHLLFEHIAPTGPRWPSITLVDVHRRERNKVNLAPRIVDHGAVVRSWQAALEASVSRSTRCDEQRAPEGHAVVVGCKDGEVRPAGLGAWASEEQRRLVAAVAVCGGA